MRQKQPRWAILGVGALEKLIKGKPTGVAAIVYAAGEGDEAFKFAQGIEGELSVAGWRITKTVPLSTDDPNQVLPQFSSEDMKKLNLPPFSKVGGLSDITVIISPADLHEGFPRAGTAAHALYFGLIGCGFEALPNIDTRLPAGAVRVVIGPKQ